MIEPLEISIAGFKSIYSEQTVKIKPLTILAGANSSGKSSFMQPLLLMKQTLEAPFDPGVFWLDGHNIKFTSIEQIIARNAKNIRTPIFSIKFEEQLETYKLNYSISENIKLKIEKIEFKKTNEFQVISKENGDFLSIKKGNKFHSQAASDLKECCDKLDKLIDGNVNLQKETEYKFFKKNRYFFDINPMITYLGNERTNCEEFVDRHLLKVMAFCHKTVFQNNKLVKKILHVSGLRDTSNRSYPVAETETEQFSGQFQEYIASIIESWQNDNNSEKIKELCCQLSALQITNTIHAKRVNSVSIELYIDRFFNSNIKDHVNIADVGIGVSHVLPILVALLVAESKQLIYIEQPELHLHPRAQLTLASIIAKAVKRGVRVVIETHSSLLITGIQTLVAKDELDAELVSLNWFSRDTETGETSITSSELDKNGAFGDWPMDFDDVMLGAQSDYIGAVEEKMFNGD